MDACEATRVVFSRIQSLDPEHAAKIMGLLLIQDHGEKEMIRLAFGPESLLHSVVLRARKDLGLIHPPTSSTAPGTPTSAGTPPPLPAPAPAPFLLARQNSASRLPSPLSVSSPSSWAPPPIFSRSGSVNKGVNGSVGGEEMQSGSDEGFSPSSGCASPFYGGGGGEALMEEFPLQDQLAFLGEPPGAKPGGEVFYGDVGGGGGGWGENGSHHVHHHRRSISDICLGAAAAAADGGWKPCLYYARGYCKNGSSCRFVHGLPDDAAAALAAGMKMDAAVEQQCQELLLRSKSQRLIGAAAAAAAFPYSPMGLMPPSPSSSPKCLSFFLQQQQQQSESQRYHPFLLFY